MAIENSAIIGGEELLKLAEKRQMEILEMPKDASHRDGETKEVIEKLTIEAQEKGIVIDVSQLQELMVQSSSIEKNNQKFPSRFGRRFPERRFSRGNRKFYRLV